MKHSGSDLQKDCAAFVAAKPANEEKNIVQSTKHTQRVKWTQTPLPLLAAPVPFACM